MRAHETARRAREQDAGEKPGHDPADDPPAAGIGGEFGCEGHRLLRGAGQHPDDEACRREAGEVRARSRRDQGGGEPEQLPDDQVAPRQGVAQRHEEEDAEPVADEARRRHGQGGVLTELGNEHREQRLIVIDVGHRPAGDQGQPDSGQGRDVAAHRKSPRSGQERGEREGVGVVSMARPLRQARTRVPAPDAPPGPDGRAADCPPPFRKRAVACGS